MAGAGYKLFNTGDVLTAAQVNTYLQEQAVMRFANATARTTALSGVLAEGMVSYLDDTNALEVYNGTAWVGAGSSGDIEGVTAGTGISGGGTSGTVTITNSMATAIDAKGDLIVGTGADTFARLAVGTNDYVLTAASGETTGLKWAAAASGGGFTLLETLSLSGTSTTSSSIANTYKHLFIEIKDIYLSGNDTVALRVNGSSSGYYFHQLRIDSTTVSADNPSNFSQFQLVDLGNNSSVENRGYGTIWIPRYTDTSSVVEIQSTVKGYIAGNMRSMITWGFQDNSAAVSTVNFRTGGSVTFSAGTAYIYGVS